MAQNGDDEGCMATNLSRPVSGANCPDRRGTYDGGRIVGHAGAVNKKYR